MSEKRFRVCADDNNCVGLLDNSVRLLFFKFGNKEDAVTCEGALKNLCDLMNELHEENEKLNSEMKINLKEFSQLLKQNFAQKRKINDLQAENIQLKQEKK